MKFKIFYLILCMQIFLNADKLAWNGERYDKNSSLQYEKGVQAIKSFDLKGTERILDIGCGTGKTTVLCSKKVASGSIVAIDSSEDMIMFAQKNYSEISNIRFLVQDVTTMSFEEEFDFVYSIFCLHWVKDQEIAMKNIARSLKKGGKAVLYITSPNNFNKTSKEIFFELIGSPEWRFYSARMIYDTYVIPQEKWIEYAGINNLSVELGGIEDRIIYANYDEFKKRYIAYGVMPKIMEVMGEDEGKKFVDQYYKKIYYTFCSSLELPMMHHKTALILTLTKH